jgi:hypothetical protein
MMTIKTHIARSAAGNVKLTQTVVNAIASIGSKRNLMSAEDVTYVVNSNLHTDEQVTIKQVEAAIREMVAATGRGERYNGLRNGLYSIGSSFYEYK